MTIQTSRRWKNARENMRWRGFFFSSLLAARKVLSPIVYSHVWHIFQSDLQRPLAEPYAKEQVEVKVFVGKQDLEEASAAISLMGIPQEEISVRLGRGDAAAVAYVNHDAVGYMWLTFATGMELAFGVSWVLRPDQALRYGAFVARRWRGLGIHSSLNRALNGYARQRGLTRTFGGISALNPQSLNLAKHSRNPKIMTVILINIRGLNWTFAKTTGAPLHSHFSRSSKDLYRTRKSVGDEV